MAFKSQQSKGKQVTFKIAGTQTEVRPMKLVCKTGELKYNIIGCTERDSGKIVFLDSDGRPVSFKIALKRGLIVGE